MLITRKKTCLRGSSPGVKQMRIRWMKGIKKFISRRIEITATWMLTLNSDVTSLRLQLSKLFFTFFLLRSGFHFESHEHDDFFLDVQESSSSSLFLVESSGSQFFSHFFKNHKDGNYFRVPKILDSRPPQWTGAN